MPKRSCVLQLFSTLLLATLAGCGGKASVTGTVSLDGEPVANGAIAFIKSEGEPVREGGAVITNGSFRTEIPPGKYKLELTGSKVTGTRTQTGFDGKPETIQTTGELFPARYNTNTELQEEIRAGGKPLKLDLKSK
jgi:hypothetical protein